MVDEGTNHALGFPSGTSTSTPLYDIGGSATQINTPRGISIDPITGRVFVANFTNPGLIEAFPAASSGNEAPFRTISNVKAYPAALAFDSTADLWVPNCSTTPGLDEYASGGSTPILTIAGSNTGLNCPSSVTVGRSGNPIVANADHKAASWIGSVSRFNATSSGNVTPINEIVGDATGLQAPEGVSVYYDASGNGKIVVTDYLADTVSIWPIAANGNVAPSVYIPGDTTTKLQKPLGVAVDTSGDIYVADCGASAIFEYPASVFSGSGKLEVAPVHRISGLTCPRQVAIAYPLGS